MRLQWLADAWVSGSGRCAPMRRRTHRIDTVGGLDLDYMTVDGDRRVRHVFAGPGFVGGLWDADV